MTKKQYAEKEHDHVGLYVIIFIIFIFLFTFWCLNASRIQNLEKEIIELQENKAETLGVGNYNYTYNTKGNKNYTYDDLFIGEILICSPKNTIHNLTLIIEPSSNITNGNGGGK